MLKGFRVQGQRYARGSIFEGLQLNPKRFRLSEDWVKMCTEAVNPKSPKEPKP